MKERILLMGAPGSGKSEQLINVASYIQEFKLPMYVIDCEDKLSAMLENRDDSPDNIKLHVALSWEEPENKRYEGFKEAANDILKKVKPGDWIGLDRIDLSWSFVQRWFTKEKYNESLSDKLMEVSKEMKKKSMFVPRFDQGSWQVINEQYESVIVSLLFDSRCNILMTSGIKGIDNDSPLDIGRYGVLPRGQKELGHQPHSVFLLTQEKVQGEKRWEWFVSTDKDLKKREYFDKEPLFDFATQYLSMYYKPDDK